MKRLVTSGELQRLFLAEDERTIITRPNCRKFCLDNNIFMEIHEKAWLIDFKPFLEKVNPSKINQHYELPTMRNIRQCVRMWNNKHRRFSQIIDKHTVERCIKDKRVLLAQNVPIQTVSKYLGHADSTITLEVYSHFIPDTQEKVISALNNILDD